MLQNYIDMLKSSVMPLNYDVKDVVVYLDGEYVEAVLVTVVVNATGDTVGVVFHKGTDTLIDMNIKHVCTCGNSKH